MTTIERIAYEVGAALLLMIAAAIWWHVHDLNEQKLGAVACVQATTVIKADAVNENAAVQNAAAVQLQEKINDQERQLASLSAGNDDLARRVHDYALRASRMPDPAAATGDNHCPVNVSSGQGGTVESGGADRVVSAEAKLFDSCDREYSRGVEAIAAYNDWRERMIAANKKSPQG